MLTERSARVVAAVKLHRQVARRRSDTLSGRGCQPRRGRVAARADPRDLRHRGGGAAARRSAGPARRSGPRRHRAGRKSVVGHRDSGRLGRGLRAPERRLADVLARAPRLVAVGVEIGEPGNAGTLIRIADAMGADAVVFIGHSVDPYNGKCLRASAGSIFAVPVVVAPEASPRSPRCGSPGCRCWPPPWTVNCRSTTPTSRRRPRGCSDPRRTACRPRSPSGPTLGCAFRCPAAPRA